MSGGNVPILNRRNRVSLVMKHRSCYFPLTIMRRLLASLVLSVIAWGTFAPFVMATTANTTPLCCRRDGKHHCQMEMQRAESAGTPTPILLTNAPECPYRNLLLVPTAGALLHVAESPASRLLEGDFVSRQAVRSSSLFVPFSLGQRGPPNSSF